MSEVRNKGGHPIDRRSGKEDARLWLVRDGPRLRPFYELADGTLVLASVFWHRHLGEE